MIIPNIVAIYSIKNTNKSSANTKRTIFGSIFIFLLIKPKTIFTTTNKSNRYIIKDGNAINKLKKNKTKIIPLDINCVNNVILDFCIFISQAPFSPSFLL
jgi:hypothetical protein